MKIVFMTTEVPASETVHVVKDLTLDKPVDDSLFVLPAGTKVETLEMPAGTAGESAGNRPRPSLTSLPRKNPPRPKPIPARAMRAGEKRKGPLRR